MKYLFTIVLIFISYINHAQDGQIKGYIEFENEQHLPATILIQELEKHTTSNDSTFEFTSIAAGNYTLIITAVGYESLKQNITVKPYQTTNIKIRLTTSQNILDEVIIIDQQTGINSKTPYNYTSLRMDAIEGKSSPSGVMGKLREVPGVYGAEFGQGIVKPFIRGLGFSRVATIFQGNKLENQQWGADHGLGVNDLGVKSIDIIKGPASVLYGSGALGGVILINDNDFYIDSNQVSGNFGISYNSVSNGFRAFTSVGKKFENDLFFATDLAYENHADHRAGNGQIIGNSRFNMSTARVHVGIDKENFDNKLSVSINHQNLGIIGDDELENSNATRRNDRNMQLPFQEVTDVLISYNQHIYHGNFETVFHVSHHFNDRNEIETAANLIDLGLQQHNTFYNARINFDTGKVNHNIGLQGNFLSNTNKDKVLEILIPNARYNENGAYYMLNYESKSYFLQGAIRYDYRHVKANASDQQFIDAGFTLPGEPQSRTLTSNFGGLTASLGLTKSIGNNHKLKANLSSGFRSPDLAELYSFGQHPGTNRFEIGNASFKREQSFQADFNYSFIFDRWRLDASIFGSQVDNYIFFADSGAVQDGTGLQIWEYQQVKAQLYGSEFNLQYVALKDRSLRLNLAAAFVRGKNIDFNEPLTFIPPDNFNFNVTYSLGKLQNTSVFARIRSISQQDRPGFNEIITPGYSLLDVGMNSILSLGSLGQVEASLTIQNLFDKNYVDHLSILRAFNIPSPGRNVAINLNYRL
jgi:iron complex outermembrane receptor protein